MHQYNYPKTSLSYNKVAYIDFAVYVVNIEFDGPENFVIDLHLELHVEGPMGLSDVYQPHLHVHWYSQKLFCTTRTFKTFKNLTETLEIDILK